MKYITVRSRPSWLKNPSQIDVPGGSPGRYRRKAGRPGHSRKHPPLASHPWGSKFGRGTWPHPFLVVFPGAVVQGTTGPGHDSLTPFRGTSRVLFQR